MLLQSGVHLIEVLISLFLLSIALFGVDAMLIHTTKEVTVLYHVHVAMQQLMHMQERIVTERNVDLYLPAWNQQNKTVLPKGLGNYQIQNKFAKLNLHWNQRMDGICTENSAIIHCLTLPVMSS